MPVASLLPFTATPNRKSASPTSFRLTEKFILLLVFSAFITLCFGAIFFLPDSSKLLSGVFFRSSSVEPETRTGTVSDTSTGTGKDEKILAKIRKDHEKALIEAKDTLQKRPDEIKQEIMNDKEKVAPMIGEKGDSLPFVQYVRPPGATGHEPADPDIKEKRAKIKEVSYVFIIIYSCAFLRLSKEIMSDIVVKLNNFPSVEKPSGITNICYYRYVSAGGWRRLSV